MTVALTSDELSAVRNSAYRANYYLSLTPAIPFATAKVNQSIFGDPITEITVDNTSTDWMSITAGMTVWVGSADGKRDRGVYRVRKAPTSTKLYIGEISAGDAGLLSIGTTSPITDNDSITVMLDYNLWSVFPYIAYSDGDGTFYKDWDIPYTNQNESAIPGILRLGPHRAGWVNGDDELPITIPADVQTWDGATVTAYAWRIDGVASGSGSSLSHDFGIGAHVVRCTVTLSNGASMSGVRFVHAHHPTDYPPVEISITGDRRNRQGRTLNADLVGAWEAALLEGALVIIWEDGNAVSSATTQMIGFIRNLRGRIVPGMGNSAFEVISPLLALSKLVAFSQQLTYAANPDRWTQAIASLMHFDFFVFHLLYWHSTLLTLCDFVPSGLTSYTANVWKVDPGNHLAQINRAGGDIRVEITQRSDGTLSLKRDPVTMSNSERGAVIERYPLGVDDVVSVDYERSLQGEYGKVIALAFQAVAGSTPQTWAATAFKSGGQGASTQQYNGLIVLDLDELKRVASCMLLKLNNPMPRISLELVHGHDVIEPAEWGFIRLSLPADVWPEGVAVDIRAVVEDVSMSYNGPRKTTLTLVPETNGNATPAQQTPIIVGNDIDLDDIPMPAYDDYGFLVPQTGFHWGLGLPNVYGFPSAFPPPISTTPNLGIPGTVPAGIGLLIAWAEKAGYTQNPYSSSADYHLLAGFTGEHVKAVIHSNLSPWLGNPSAPLQLWALTDAALYYNDDALGSGTWDEKQAIVDGMILRKPAGVPNGIAVISFTEDSWCYEWDFTVNDGGWTPHPTFGANYSAGVGWTTNDSPTGANRTIDISLSVPSISITKVEYTYDYIKGHFTIAGNRAIAFAVNNPNDWLIDIKENAVTNGTNLQVLWEGTKTGVSLLRAAINTSYDNIPPTTYAGSALLKSLRIYGEGDMPSLTGGSAC